MFRKIFRKINSMNEIQVGLSVIGLLVLVTAVIFFLTYHSTPDNKSTPADTPTATPKPTQDATPTDTPEPTQPDSSGEDNTGSSNSDINTNIIAVPTIDCIGPDGKHLYITKDACDKFNSAWTPTATPTPAATDTPTPNPTSSDSPTPTPAATDTPTPNPSPMP